MIVVGDVRRQHATEMPLADDQDLVQARLAHRADPALRESIRIGRLHRRADDRDCLGCEHGIESNRKLAVAVVDQEAHREHSLLDLPAELTGLLRHPRTRRVGSTARQMDVATAELDEKQDVQRLQPRRFDREEVAGEDFILVMLQEGPPATAPLSSLWGWWTMLALENLPYR